MLVAANDRSLSQEDAACLNYQLETNLVHLQCHLHSCVRPSMRISASCHRKTYYFNAPFSTPSPFHNKPTTNPLQTTTMAAPSRASLLGLPRELRLAIYNIIITHEVNHDLCTLLPNDLPRIAAPTRPQFPFRTPTTPLALSCRSIAQKSAPTPQPYPPSQGTAIVELLVDYRGTCRLLLRTFPCRILLLQSLRIEFVMSNGPQDNLFASPIQSAYTMARQLTLGACALFMREDCVLGRAEGIAEVEILVICAGMRARDRGSEMEFGQLLQVVVGSTVVDAGPAGDEGSRALRLRPIN